MAKRVRRPTSLLLICRGLHMLEAVCVTTRTGGVTTRSVRLMSEITDGDRVKPEYLRALSKWAAEAADWLDAQKERP